jgi:hypothetical protein
VSLLTLSLAALRLLRSAREVRGAKGRGGRVGLPLAGNGLMCRGGLGERSSFTSGSMLARGIGLMFELRSSQSAESVAPCNSGVPCSDLMHTLPLLLPLPLPSPFLEGDELPSGEPCGMKRGDEAPSAMVLYSLLLGLLGRRKGRGSGEDVNKIDFADHVEIDPSIKTRSACESSLTASSPQTRALLSELLSADRDYLRSRAPDSLPSSA